MDKATIPIHEVARKFRVLLRTTLMPLEIAEDFERFDKRYRKALEKAGVIRKRWELRSVVDEIIIAILSHSAGLSSEQILRRIPNETFVFYSDRLLRAQEALEDLSADRSVEIEVPESWPEFWIELLVHLAAPPDPANM